MFFQSMLFFCKKGARESAVSMLSLMWGANWSMCIEIDVSSSQLQYFCGVHRFEVHLYSEFLPKGSVFPEKEKFFVRTQKYPGILFIEWYICHRNLLLVFKYIYRSKRT